MDPMTSLPSIQPAVTAQPFMNAIFIPGIFDSYRDQDDYLATLDSDTRAYVLAHTNDFRSKDDIIDCVNRLHGIS